ncbi:unnamed protein product [Amoebophrya sp. A25]|nr:unnamed protein product [Amoebophrya sp. A25]|eukprot:GSA25T00000662001.1
MQPTPTHLSQLSGLLDPGYIAQAEQGLHSASKRVTQLLSHRRLPKQGWSDLEIEAFLRQVALLDANNAEGNVGVGEREGRVYSRLVQARHFGLTHGVGRSGDLVAQQPKAVGSSLVNGLCRYLALDAVRLSGFRNCKDAMVVPLATGMSLLMCFLALQQIATSESAGIKKKYIIWSRIDQKSCFKSITSAGFIPVVVELCPTVESSGEGLETDVEGIEAKIQELGPENVLCVFCTTSTFAPRVPDKVEDVAKVCKKLSTPLVINNAYGLQCSRIMQSIETASRVGRVDAIVQSTDKNFMVPVGGSIICAGPPLPPEIASKPGSGTSGANGNISGEAKTTSVSTPLTVAAAAAADSSAVSRGGEGVTASTGEVAAQTRAKPPKPLLDQIAKCYPGRASGAQMLDLLITLLSMGQDGLQSLWKDRKTNFDWFREELNKTIAPFGLRTLDTRENKISICVDLSDLPLVDGNDIEESNGASSRSKKLNSIGAKLFNHRVSGPRVVACPAGAKTIDGMNFLNYGAHSNDYAFPYLATAVAIGVERHELETFLTRLTKTLTEECGTATKSKKQRQSQDSKKQAKTRV